MFRLLLLCTALTLPAHLALAQDTSTDTTTTQGTTTQGTTTQGTTTEGTTTEGTTNTQGTTQTDANAGGGTDASGQGTAIDAAMQNMPEACRTAAKAAPADPNSPVGDPALNQKSSEMMKGYGTVMERMRTPMMASMLIQDPDLAFACAMIAHHQGAVDMANMLKDSGKDDKMKEMAQKMVDAQKQEIDQLTAWVEDHGKAP